MRIERVVGFAEVSVYFMENEEIDYKRVVEQLRNGESLFGKDDAWVLITQSLSYLAREAFKRFFNPKYHIEERAIKLLNLMENDRKM